MQILFGKGFLRFSEGNQLAMKKQNLIKISWNLAEIVMDDQDGLAFLFQGLECLHDDVFANGPGSGRLEPVGIALLKAGQSGDPLDQGD